MLAQSQVSRFTTTAPRLLEQLQQALPKPYRIVADRAPAQDAVVLDTFDDDLWRQGKVLISTDNTLLLLAEHSVVSPAPGRKLIGFKADITDEALREALDKLPDIRRLLPQDAFSLSHYKATVVDDYDKTCVRLSLVDVKTKQSSASYVELQSLRGYEKPYTLLYNALLQMDAEPKIDATRLFARLGYRTYNYVSNPEISLQHDISVMEASTRIVTTYLDVARLNEDGMFRDLDSEFLHDYRISLRRIRSLISLFKGVWSKDSQGELKQRFSALMRTTNRLRDLDVYLLDQAGYYDLLPATMHDGLDQIFASFRRERRQQWKKLATRLQSEDYQQEMQILRGLFEPAGGLEQGPVANDLALDYARKLITKHYKRVCRIARGIDESTPDEEVHELRIQCKKLRYLLDFFMPLMDKKAIKTVIKSLKKLQDNLGRFNDYSGQQIALQEFLDQQLQSGKKVSPKMIEAIGALVALKHQLQLKERALVMESFANFHSEETEQLIQTLCSTPVETPAQTPAE
jgi:CHAD domain-containing protein